MVSGVVMAVLMVEGVFVSEGGRALKGRKKSSSHRRLNNTSDDVS